MNTTAFDTLVYSNTLQEVSRKLAAKSDLLELKYEILQWMVGLAVAQIAMSVALFALK